MQLKAVFFDLDDTLYSGFTSGDAEGFQRCGNYVAQHLGLDAKQFATIMRACRESLKDRLPQEPEIHDRVLCAQQALEQFGINPIPHAEALHDVYWSGVFDHMVIRSGVIELLDTLRAHQICIGVCTNMLAGMQMRKLYALGLADKIDFLVTSEEAGRDKPDPAIFHLALRKAGCSPEQALMVGDNFSHDILGAHNANIAGLWLHVHDEPSKIADFPYFEAFDFAQAAKYIQSLIPV